MKSEINKVKFWTPLRLACTVIAFGLLAAFGVSSCNSNDPSSPASANRPGATPNRAGFTTLPQPLLQAENRGTTGTPIKLGDYSGKVLFVNLWATWCGPCRMETPELVKLNKEFKDRGVEMIGLSTEDPDSSAQAVQEFVRAYNVDYQIGWAKPELALGLMQGRTNIPQSFIIARDGRIIRRFIGFSPQSTPVQLRQALEQALIEKS
ncbi:MAG TPA: TlpA disulfide reductase family protein [Pyrinomonadaceae bacterium]|nr:TlpA disulfide reductase family protein [Pyrinomonadaceae bacterium]